MAKPAWARRNELAQERGYQSYYDYRTHGYGARPPGEPRATGGALRMLRGHASYSDFLAVVKSGRAEVVSQIPGERDRKTGRYKTVIVDVKLTNGETRKYTLKGDQLKKQAIADLNIAMTAAGVEPYANPSVDITSDAYEPPDEPAEYDFEFSTEELAI